ncbi:amino acid transporter [Halobellus salinus]|uniref:Amino acid transporter n=1 Tax=Halobellus salinus TaxID=931585 RepID=A0A830ERM9_9EURY|nr:LysE family transporter [Halobellus salinus]GGJ14990.1 amino acid transporter [Halobellus salinus]SMP32653.1 Threonine/homoserine/homoserine lactone efflux protein [Halobellus salinus]
MAATLVTFAAGVVFGIALAAPPGPMNAIIAEESVLRGWVSGFKAGLGAMSADAVFFVLAALGVVAFVERFPLIRAAMVGVGGVLMLYFAYDAASDVQSSFRGAVGADEDTPGRAEGGADTDAGTEAVTDVVAGTGFRKAFVLALTNPYQILFWLTIGVGLLRSGTLDVLAETPYIGGSLAGVLVVETGTMALVAGFFSGIVVWITGFPAALVGAERRIDAFAPVVAGLSAVVLAGFGVLFLTRSAGVLLG